MKRTRAGALYSAAFCAISASIYFTADAYSPHSEISLGIVWSFIMIAGFAVPIAGTYGLFLGLIGTWLLPRLPFIQTKFRFVTTAALAGVILGCIPPVIPRILIPANPGPLASFRVWR